MRRRYIISAGLAIFFGAALVAESRSNLSGIGDEQTADSLLRESEYRFAYQLCIVLGTSDNADDGSSAAARERAQALLAESRLDYDAVAAGISSFLRVDFPEMDENEKGRLRGDFLAIVNERLSRLEAILSIFPNERSLNPSLPAEESERYSEEMNRQIRKNRAIYEKLKGSHGYRLWRDRFESLRKKIEKL